MGLKMYSENFSYKLNTLLIENYTKLKSFKQRLVGASEIISSNNFGLYLTVNFDTRMERVG
jgi:hypothetical protein